MPLPLRYAVGMASASGKSAVLAAKESPMSRKHSLTLSPAALAALASEYADNGAIEQAEVDAVSSRGSRDDDEIEALVDASEFADWDLS